MKTRKFLAVLLSLAMTLSLLPVGVFADGELEISITAAGVASATPSTPSNNVSMYLLNDAQYSAVEEDILTVQKSAADSTFVTNEGSKKGVAYDGSVAITAETLQEYTYLLAVEYEENAADEDAPVKSAVINLEEDTPLANNSLKVTLGKTTEAGMKGGVNLKVEDVEDEVYYEFVSADTTVDNVKTLTKQIKSLESLSVEYATSGKDIKPEKTDSGKIVIAYTKSGNFVNAYGVSTAWTRVPDTDLKSAEFPDETNAATLEGQASTSVESPIEVTVSGASVTAKLTANDKDDVKSVFYKVDNTQSTLANLTKAESEYDDAGGVLTVDSINVSGGPKYLTVALGGGEYTNVEELAAGKYSLYVFKISGANMTPTLTAVNFESKGEISITAASLDPENPTTLTDDAKTTKYIEGGVASNPEYKQSLVLTLAEDESVKWSFTELNAEQWNANTNEVQGSASGTVTITENFIGHDALYLQVESTQGDKGYLKLPLYVYGDNAAATLLSATFGQTDASDTATEGDTPELTGTYPTQEGGLNSLADSVAVALNDENTVQTAEAITVALTVPSTMDVAFKRNIAANNWTDVSSDGWTDTEADGETTYKKNLSFKGNSNLYVMVSPQDGKGGTTTYYWFQVTKTASTNTAVTEVKELTTNVTGAPDANKAVRLAVANTDARNYKITLADANAKVAKYNTYASTMTYEAIAADIETNGKDTSLSNSGAVWTLTGIEALENKTLALLVVAEDGVSKAVYTVTLSAGSATLSGKMLLLKGASFASADDDTTKPQLTVTLDGYEFKQGVTSEQLKSAFTFEFKTNGNTPAALGLEKEKVVVGTGANANKATVYFTSTNVTDADLGTDLCNVNLTIATSVLDGNISTTSITANSDDDDAKIGVFELTRAPATKALMPGQTIDETYDVAIDEAYYNSGVTFAADADKFTIEKSGDAINGNLTKGEVTVENDTTAKIAYTGTAADAGKASLTVTVEPTALTATGYTFYGTKTFTDENYFEVKSASLNYTDIYVMADSTPAATELTLTTPEAAKATGMLTAAVVGADDVTASEAYSVLPENTAVTASTNTQTLNLKLTPKTATVGGTEKLKITAPVAAFTAATVPYTATANLHLAKATLSGGNLLFARDTTMGNPTAELTVTLTGGVKFDAAAITTAIEQEKVADVFELYTYTEVEESEIAFTPLDSNITVTGCELSAGDTVAKLTVTCTSPAVDAAPTKNVMVKIVDAIVAPTAEAPATNLLAKTEDNKVNAFPEEPITVTVGEIKNTDVTGDLEFKTNHEAVLYLEMAWKNTVTVTLTNMQFADALTKEMFNVNPTDSNSTTKDKLTVESVTRASDTTVNLTIKSTANDAHVAEAYTVTVSVDAIKDLIAPAVEEEEPTPVLTIASASTVKIDLAPTATVTVSKDETPLNAGDITLTLSDIVNNSFAEVENGTVKAIVSLKNTNTNDVYVIEKEVTLGSAPENNTVTLTKALLGSAVVDGDEEPVPVGVYDLRVAIMDTEDTPAEILPTASIKYVVDEATYMASGTAVAANANYAEAKTINGNSGDAPKINLTKNVISSVDSDVSGTAKFETDNVTLKDITLTLKDTYGDVKTSENLWVKPVLVGSPAGIEIDANATEIEEGENSVTVSGIKIYNSNASVQNGVKIKFVFYTDAECQTLTNFATGEIALDPIAASPAGATVTINTGYKSGDTPDNSKVTAGHNVTFRVTNVKNAKGTPIMSDDLYLSVYYAGSGYTNPVVNHEKLTNNDGTYTLEANEQPFTKKTSVSAALTFVIEEQGEGEEPTVIASSKTGEVVGTINEVSLQVYPSTPKEIAFKDTTTALSVETGTDKAVLKQTDKNIELTVQDTYGNAISDNIAMVKVTRSLNENGWTLYTGAYVPSGTQTVTVPVESGEAKFTEVGLHATESAVSITDTLHFSVVNEYGEPYPEWGTNTVNTGVLTFATSAGDAADKSQIVIKESEIAVAHGAIVTLPVENVLSTSGKFLDEGATCQGKVTLTNSTLQTSKLNATLTITETTKEEGTNELTGNKGTLTFTAPADVGTYTINNTTTDVVFTGFNGAAIKTNTNGTQVTIKVQADANKLELTLNGDISAYGADSNNMRQLHEITVTIKDDAGNTASTLSGGKMKVVPATEGYIILGTTEVDVTAGEANFDDLKLLNITNEPQEAKLKFTYTPDADDATGGVTLKDMTSPKPEQLTTTQPIQLAKSNSSATITVTDADDNADDTIEISSIKDYAGETPLAGTYDVTYQFVRNAVSGALETPTTYDEVTVEDVPYISGESLTIKPATLPTVGGIYDVIITVAPSDGSTNGPENGLHVTAVKNFTFDGSAATVTGIQTAEIMAGEKVQINLTDIKNSYDVPVVAGTKITAKVLFVNTKDATKTYTATQEFTLSSAGTGKIVIDKTNANYPAKPGEYQVTVKSLVNAGQFIETYDDVDNTVKTITGAVISEKLTIKVGEPVNMVEKTKAKNPTISSGAGFAPTFSFLIEDIMGNPVAGAEVTAEIGDVDGVMLDGNTTLTADDNGIVNFSDLCIENMNKKAVTVTLTFSIEEEEDEQEGLLTGTPAATTTTSRSYPVTVYGTNVEGETAITITKLKLVELDKDNDKLTVTAEGKGEKLNTQYSGITFDAVVGNGGKYTINAANAKLPVISQRDVTFKFADGADEADKLDLVSKLEGYTAKFDGTPSAAQAVINVTAVGAPAKLVEETAPENLKISSGAGFAPTFSFKVEDSNGVAVAGATVTAAISTADGVSLKGTTSPTTDDNGIVNFSDLWIENTNDTQKKVTLTFSIGATNTESKSYEVTVYGGNVEGETAITITKLTLETLKEGKLTATAEGIGTQGTRYGITFAPVEESQGKYTFDASKAILNVISQGKVKFTFANAADELILDSKLEGYKEELDKATDAANAVITLEEIVTVAKPVISVDPTNLQVTMTAEEGVDIYYTVGNGAETKYTAPFLWKISTSGDTISAYAKDAKENMSEPVVLKLPTLDVKMENKGAVQNQILSLSNYDNGGFDETYFLIQYMYYDALAEDNMAVRLLIPATETISLDAGWTITSWNVWIYSAKPDFSANDYGVISLKTLSGKTVVDN